jgi:thiamine biosynthesis protein ThiS
MRISVNGEGREVPPATTVAALLELLLAPRPATAVEVNRRLVPRAEHAAHALAEGDAVEIVTLVGGG